MKNPKKNYEIIAIGDIQLQVVKDSRVEKNLAKNINAVDKIWQKALKETRGKLQNKTLPNFIKIDRKKNEIKVIAHFVEYKYFFAQIKQPDLQFGIRPVGVSGITVLKENADDYIIFAKRTHEVTEYPGFFELVPSGSIDKENADNNGIINYKSKLLSEFTEETGLSGKIIKKITGFALVLDIDHQVYDICSKILLNTKKEIISKRFLATREYDKPIFVSLGDLDVFLGKNVSKIIPTSMAIIKAYLLK